MERTCLRLIFFFMALSWAYVSAGKCKVTIWSSYVTTTSCGFWGWSRCRKVVSYSYQAERCCAGYNGDDCNTPICNPVCQNGGTCIAPNTCDCPISYVGDTCGTPQCSHRTPCFPGVCSYPNHCNCFEGFTGSTCLTFDSDNNLPVMSSCGITLAHIRRADNKQRFYLRLPCSDGPTKDMIWSNQERFNYAEFVMEGFYQPTFTSFPNLNYVTNSAFGIVYGGMNIIHTKISRDGGSTRYNAFRMTYNCSSVSDTNPEKNIFDCKNTEPDYDTSVEHGDVFTATYTVKSGGFADLKDVDTDMHYKTEIFIGQTTTKQIELKFDFDAPVHCSETGVDHPCPSVEPFEIPEDITRNPVVPRWSGWSDKLSGMSYYLLEVFTLGQTIHGELIEQTPLVPLFAYYINASDNISSQNLSLTTPGMYSVLLQASDMANNSKIARRLVLFDDESTITLTKTGLSTGMPDLNDVISMSRGDGGMHVISAIPETGYMWQTSENGTKSHIILNWENHFVNKLYDDGNLLSEVLPYPIQFQDLQEDGILRSEKFVALDDHEGSRTVDAILNIHGIVTFEVKRVYTDDKVEPLFGWLQLPLKEQYEFTEQLDDGSHIRLWIRATDIMNHTKADYTEVHVDNSPPRVGSESIQFGVVNGSYTYTSRVQFDASDDGSGVHKIEYSILIDNNTETREHGFVQANINNATGACQHDPSCNCILDVCFKPRQQIDIDNCWFLVPQDDLNKTGHIVITVYNQALLIRKFNFTISPLSELRGLEEYSGPSNIRVAEKLPNGIRLEWDLPKTASCYGRVDIFVLVYFSDGTFRTVRVKSDQRSVDILGLEPDSHYTASLNLGYHGTDLAAMPFSFRTAPKENYLAAGIVAAIAVSVVVIIAIMMTIFIILLRRGHLKPVRRGLSAVSRQYRKSVAGLRARRYTYDNHERSITNKTYIESLYMYGDMEYNDPDSWKMSRDDIVLESLLTSGSFADIYRATSRSLDRQVVAKKLKQGFKDPDTYLMKAKINFLSIEVGKHENILEFVGAVVDDTDAVVGPMIILEYCNNGQLNDYLAGMRSNLTVETHELLFRFGVQVARGMEYLANKKIVHSRLAARNVLLTDTLDAKITGFCPKREDQDRDDDGDAKKREHRLLSLDDGTLYLYRNTLKSERIPVKWVAPECIKSSSGANEQSDVWSYGVVLWEIFSLGETPYNNIRGRDMPGKLKGGYRLPKPESCEDKWYGVMKKCWSYEAKGRPSFIEIRGELDELFIPAEENYYMYRR